VGASRREESDGTDEPSVAPRPPQQPEVPPLPGTAPGRPSGKGSKGKGKPPPGKSAPIAVSTPPGSAPASRGSSPSKPKGKGKGPPGVAPQGKGKSNDQTPGGPRFVNMHWRSSLEPKEQEVSTADDVYLSGMVAHMPRKEKTYLRCRENLSLFERTVGIGDADDAFCLDSATRDDGDAPFCSPSPRPKCCEPGTPLTGTKVEMAMTPAASTPTPMAGETTPGVGSRRRRTRRNTIFSEDCPVQELSQKQLEKFFQIKPTAVNALPRSSIVPAGPVRTLISDPKHLQIIDILVKKEAIQRHKGMPGQQSEEAAVEALINALRTCDYERFPPQALEDIRKVIIAHLEVPNRQTILQFVEEKGEDALQGLEHPHLHQLLYGALRIPAISARLECMIAEATRDESLGHCRGNLEILRTGLNTISGLLRPLARFCAAAREVGNTLNRDSSNSSAGVSGHGFKMLALVKLMELKSPLRKEVSLFHLVLLLLPREEVAQLCDSSAIEDLNRARSARSFTVYQVCIQFFQAFTEIQKLVDTGRYQGEEIPLDVAEAERDVFFEKMRTFTENTLPDVSFVEGLCRQVFETYRGMSSYFEDSKCFYPPPSDEQNEEKKDLFDHLHWLLASIKQGWKEIGQMQLEAEFNRTLLTARPRDSPSAAPEAKVTVPQDLGARRLSFSETPRGLPKATPPKQWPTVLTVAEEKPMQAAPTVDPDLVAQTNVPREPALAARNGESPKKHVTKEPRISDASIEVGLENQPPVMGPPPKRRVMGVSPGNSPVKMRTRLSTSSIGSPTKGFKLALPGVAKAGTPMLQSSVQGAPIQPAWSLPISGFDSTTSSASAPGTASGDASGRSSSPAGDSPNSPSGKMRKCRKSITSLANKVERQGCDKLMLSARDVFRESPDRSPSPDGDEFDTMQTCGFAAQIREGARMHRKSRNLSPRPSSPRSSQTDDSYPEERPWLSPRRVRSRDISEYNPSKYPLSPVFEQAEGSTALQSPLPCRGSQGALRLLQAHDGLGTSQRRVQMINDELGTSQRRVRMTTIDDESFPRAVAVDERLLPKDR